jgi:hypothetical protein
MCQSLAVALSMIVIPERKDICLLAVGEGLGLGCRDVRVGVEVMDEHRLDVLVRLVALVGPAAVGHEVYYGCLQPCGHGAARAACCSSWPEVGRGVAAC